MTGDGPPDLPEHEPVPALPDDGVLLEARADPTPLLVALGSVLVAVAALVVAVLALVD